MTRIFFYSKPLPEVSAFITKHKASGNYKFVRCRSIKKAKEEVIRRGIEKEDVMVFVISDKEKSQEIVEEIADLRTTHENIKIIICMSEYSCISEVFELKPDYVMNLCQINDKLIQVIDRLSNKATEGDGVVITKYGKSYCISPDNILCFVKENRRVKIVLSNGETFLFRAKLIDMSERLPDYFVRCHISCIINIKKVVKLLDKDVILAGDDTASEVVMPVSRARKKEIKQRVRGQKNKIN